MERSYFCPLCETQFHRVEDLTLDHAPPEALNVPSIKVLTCRRCNGGAGVAQNHLLQAHRLYQLNNSGLAEPFSIRVTLGTLTVNARVWKDANGIQADPSSKHNKPGAVEAFQRAYLLAEESAKITLSSLVHFNQSWIRWSLVREAYLLLFYHWGYWLLKTGWAKEVQELLKTPETSLPRGCFVRLPPQKYNLSPTQGEFLTARLPSQQSCWLVPIVDDCYAVMPSDDRNQKLSSLWEEMTTVESGDLPLTNCVKILVNRDVKNSHLWKVSQHEDSTATPDFWLEITPN